MSLTLPEDAVACASAVREWLATARADARARHAAGQSAIVTAAQLAEAAETVVLALHARAVAGARVPPHALVAAGGLGRRELAPASDLDLVIVSSEPHAPATKELVDRLLYPLWDARVDVGHAVRSPALFADLAAADDTVRTTAVDWRPLAGDAGLIAELDARLDTALRASSTRRYVAGVVREWTALESPATLHRLEPNVKTGPGGLRELQRVWWVARLLWHVRAWPDLLARSLVDPHDFSSLSEGKEVILGIRLAMHFLAGRRQDALRFDLQDEVAAHLRIAARGDQSPGDRLMATFYMSAKAVRSAASRVLERCAEDLVTPRRKPHTAELDGFVAFNKRLTVADPKHFEKHPLDLVRIFRVAQLAALPIHEHLRARISEQAPRLLTEAVCTDPRATRLFLDVIGDSRGAGYTLELMHDLGVLARLMPEFEHVTGLVQRDTYHTYTVDAHLVFCARRAMEVLDGRAEGVPQDIDEVARRVARRGLLVLSALMHDIGKGWGHGHSERGAAMAMTAGQRLGLSAEDTADLSFLVLEHLTMFKLSQRRDLNDPELVQRLAASVETPERLDLLYLLSYADATTTGPEAWNDWKGQLLRELYNRTRKALSGGAAKDTVASRARARRVELEQALGEERGLARLAERLPPRHLVIYPTAALIEHLRALERVDAAGAACRMRAGGGGAWEVVVAGPDRPGLLADLAAVLASTGVSIDAAHIASTVDGVIVDTFVVRAGHWPALADTQRRAALIAELERAVPGGIDTRQKLEERRRAAKILRSGAPLPRARVVWDLDASPDATVADVFAPDRVGLLHDIARAIFSEGASVVLARVTTEGERAVDAFYLVDARSGRPLDAEQRGRVEQAVLAAVQTP